MGFDQERCGNEGAEIPVNLSGRTKEEGVIRERGSVCDKEPGFLSKFDKACEHKFKHLRLDTSAMFIYLVAIVTSIAVLSFGYVIGKNDYEGLNQPSSEVAPWVVLVVISAGIILGAFGSYILHQMTEGIVRYTFMLTFLLVLLLITIAFIALFLFSSPSSAQYISLLAIVISLWFAVFAGTISYVASGLFILVGLATGFLFVVASRISAVN